MNEKESPTAAWRAAVRDRFASDMERIARNQENFRKGVRTKPINGANWDAESLGLVPQTTKREFSDEQKRFREYARIVREVRLERAVDRFVEDILAGRKK